MKALYSSPFIIVIILRFSEMKYFVITRFFRSPFMGQNHRWPSHLNFGKTIEKPSMSMVNLGKNIQCTMGYAMSIDILEVHKSKNSLHAHFILKSIHSFFIWCKTTKILTKYQNLIFFAHIWGVIVEKLKGGSEKVEILVA